MKVVVAVDSFKGSLSSMEAGNAIKKGILSAVPDAQVIVSPVADGGEGTTDALMEGLGGKRVYVKVHNPLMKLINASYGLFPDSKVAVMEMAAAAGITLIDNKDRNPLKATTYGVGEMILDVIEKGGRDFIIGIGGSATNDCGIGMLQAFGYRFIKEDGKEIMDGLMEIDQIVKIDDTSVRKELKECRFRIACDVKNPLYGKNGATYIYGGQKGLRESDREMLDKKIKKYSEAVGKYTGTDFRETEGAGAAGGLGYAFLSFLGASLKPGISLILQVTGLEKSIVDADYVITGEGQLDRQTAMGKVPIGVAAAAKKYGIPVIALAGSLSEDAELCNEKGIDAIFSILPRTMTLKEAMEKKTAERNLISTTKQLFRILISKK